MRLYIGTSGFAYKGWKGSFYPQGIAERDLLSWYARQFNAVEINSTFYRFPTLAGLATWASQVPGSFRFSIKVPQRITHAKRLYDVDEDLHYLIDTITTLGPRLGPLLFQLPPRFQLDRASLEDLIAQLPPKLRVAFEFRHPSWLCDEIYRLLADNGCALGFNDEIMTTLRATTDWGYLRLRRGEYTAADLTAMASQVLGQPWKSAYVFFKHESPDAPGLAQQWREIASKVARST
ncbi:DUF72 domain-containing protein [Thiohalomonas denitrificans]|uniref:Uncharacterized conserved protein YecE, DUF72 family n=1 Tax=Thiohalomonas denitrificans TaxID=415747 RepID=A0A1G5QQP4_9GAMM|nr:DUF72 domain-containing protein [Thiohalomonas denitrificans]SCZ64072.1 Uncharacterized conserved protein YecE, DUF72 family [Thiohalomonas denitrificans]